MIEYWEQIGYTPCTTFWQDFSIADAFVGVELHPVEDTYKRAMEYAKTDYKYMTELVLVMNHKICQWYQVSPTRSILYDRLWRDAEEKFFELFENNEEAVHYYYLLRGYGLVASWS